MFFIRAESWHLTMRSSESSGSTWSPPQPWINSPLADVPDGSQTPFPLWLLETSHGNELHRVLAVNVLPQESAGDPHWCVPQLWVSSAGVSSPPALWCDTLKNCCCSPGGAVSCEVLVHTSEGPSHATRVSAAPHGQLGAGCPHRCSVTSVLPMCCSSLLGAFEHGEQQALVWSQSLLPWSLLWPFHD